MTHPEHTPKKTPGRLALARRTGRSLFRRADWFGARIDSALGLREETRERGQATIEFVILFPVFMGLFLMSFEASLLLTRQLMLERALDVVMRDVRLSTGTTWRQDQLRADVCDNATVLPDCNANLVIEMTRIDTANYVIPSTNAPCIERTETAQAFDIDNLLTQGAPNELMLVRACYVIDPVFPGHGLGLEIVERAGEIQLVAASAFVQEP
jgi:hypothetical protein